VRPRARQEPATDYGGAAFAALLSLQACPELVPSVGSAGILQATEVQEVSMAKGLSIHIGLNSVDPNHYFDENGKPWPGNLVACESDAKAMKAIADKQGFASTILLTQQATSDNVISCVRDAAQQLQAGDILFLSYAGHGGQVPDQNGDEPDAMDETWCLYDRELVDDELYALWQQFNPGVRILMLSDSCHSGSVAKDLDDLTAGPEDVSVAIRALPADVQAATYQINRATYDAIQASTPPAESGQVAASVILISGCQDNQVSYDGKVNGLFTEKVLQTWRDGRFRGSIAGFQKDVLRRMPLYQTPNFFEVGAANSSFEHQRPFTI
jgi:metacaspase-1